jgi:hypothetical protein
MIRASGGGLPGVNANEAHFIMISLSLSFLISLSHSSYIKLRVWFEAASVVSHCARRYVSHL